MIRAYDLDGVICDFNEAYRTLIVNTFNLDLPPISDSFPAVWRWDKAAGLTNKQNNTLWSHIKASEFWLRLPPTDNGLKALDMLHELRVQGDAIYFITSRPGKWAKEQTEEWLSMNGYACPTVLISFDKGSVCKGLGIEMFVDDKTENCWDVNKACPEAQVFLLDAPYNRTPDACWVDKGEIVRVQSILDPRIMGQGALVDG